MKYEQRTIEIPSWVVRLMRWPPTGWVLRASIATLFLFGLALEVVLQLKSPHAGQLRVGVYLVFTLLAIPVYAAANAVQKACAEGDPESETTKNNDH